MAVRLQDIARKLNMSSMTVSRVLNRPEGTYISPETERRVLQAVAEMGYRPNRHARALSTGRTYTIAIWISHLHSSVYSQIARYCREGIEQAGLAASLSAMDWHFSAATSHRRFEWPVDGILAVDPPEPDALADLVGGAARLEATPRVNLGSGRAVEWSGSYVRVDLCAGTRVAIEHLAAAGCRRIAYSVPVGMHVPASGNYDAYAGAMQRAGLAPELIVHEKWDMALARATVREYIALRGKPDGIYCHNDELAIAAFRAVRDLGLRVPDDVLIIGCEGSEYMEYFDPPLSTISIPIRTMCATAWDLLKARLDDPDAPAQQILLPPQFLERESSAFPR